MLDTKLSDLCVFLCLSRNRTVITIWLTVTKYPYLKWQWIFFFLCRCFLSPITAKTFTGQDCIYEYHGGCLIKSRNYLLFVSTCVCPVFCLWSMLLIVLVFYVVLLCVFTFWVACCDVRYDLRIKTMFDSSLPPVVCRWAHVLLTFFAFVYE